MNKSFRAEWVKGGYGSVMGSAEVVLPPPPEFIRVYHLLPLKHAESDIVLRRLKVARFADLNDPFELLALSFKELAVERIVREFKIKCDEHTGLLCFSADWTNPVLWSHYADNHRGVCLGFDLGRSRAEAVRYEDERILAQLGDPPNPLNLDENLQRLLLRTKFRHWEYESEYRVFVPLKDAISDGGSYFVPFGPDLQLREVVLGPLCKRSLDDLRALTHASYPDASVIKGRLASKFFKVVPDEVTVPVFA
jgi:DUF2971 family protein